MPKSKSGSNLRQVKAWQRDVARAEYLRHPDASITEVSKATGVAVRTVARAREALVKEGLLAPGRNNLNAADAAALAVNVKEAAEAALNAAIADRIASDEQAKPPSEGVPDALPAVPLEVALGPATKKGQTLDGDALRKMNEMLDALEDEDDDKTRERMLKQLRRFAFDPSLHPDTRMSASQLWAKLLDMKRAKDLGPGVPLTLADAITRCTDFLRACGPKVAVPAFYAAFDLGDPNGDPSPQTVVEGIPAPTPAVAAGPPDNDPPTQGEA